MVLLQDFFSIKTNIDYMYLSKNNYVLSVTVSFLIIGGSFLLPIGLYSLFNDLL